MNNYIKIIIIFLFLGLSKTYANGFIKIQNINSGLCLEVRGKSKAPGALIQQAKCVTSDSQIFYTHVHNDGSYIFKNKHSGLCIDVLNSVRGQATLQQSACTHLLNQNFTPKFIAKDQYSLISQLDGGCFDIPSSSKAAGVRVQKFKCNESGAQRYKLSVLSGSIPLIVNMPAEKVITPSVRVPLPKIFKGVNLTGAESGNLTTKNRFGYDYLYPTQKHMDYFASKGFTIIRVPFKMGRLQPTLSGPLDLKQLAALDVVVQYANKKGMYVILDPHDYGSMLNAQKQAKLIGSAEMPVKHFVNFWARMAYVYSKQPNVMFNLINEPSRIKDPVTGAYISLKANGWQASAIAAVSAIRSVGAKQAILIPGVQWTGAHSWISSKNGDAWAYFKDSNYLIEVHQYLDRYSTGTVEACHTGYAAKSMVSFTNWAKTYGHKAFVGEFGWGKNANCLNEGLLFVNFMEANSSVFRGWTYFGAGFFNGHMTLNPLNLAKPNQQDQPQLETLVRAL